MKTSGEWALLGPGGTYHKLCEPNFFVGREDDMDLTLKSRSVDKKHAVITVKTVNNLYKLHDLGTLNGTFVNEVRVKQQPVDLQLRDNIRFGYDSNTFRVDLYPQRNAKSPLDTQQHLSEIQHLSENGRSLEETQMKSHNEAPTERNSDEDLPRPGTAEQGVFMYHGMHSPHLHQSQYHHYPYPYMPMYHHPPVVCRCSLCTGQYRPVHSAHGPAPGGFGHYQQASHANWSLGTAALQSRPRLQRPMSVPGDKIEMMVKGSPLYGQPPWWGWGSSDDEVYSYPNTATILDSDNHASPQALAVRRKKPLTKRDTIEMAQRRNITGSVSVLSESKAQIVTTSQMTYDSGPERALKQRQECVVFQKESGLPRPSYGDQLSPVFENSTTMDWESPSSYKERIDEEATYRNFDSSADTSPDDASDEQWRYSYEIPFIPDYDEVPERPVSQKGDRGKGTPQDTLHVGKTTSVEKQDRLSRKKVCGKIKKKTVPLDIQSGKDGRVATAARRLSSDTSESDCEPSSQPSRRSGLVALTPPNSRVFGLTEVNLQRGNDGERIETFSPTPPFPSWVQQWSNSSNSHDSFPAQPIEVAGSSSAAEDSAASSTTSTTSHAVMNQGPETDKSKAVTSSSLPSQSRPRSAVSRGPVVGVARSQSLSSSSKFLASRVARSKTISAAVRRSYPTAVSDVDGVKKTEIPRRRGTVSSTSEDSDVESSDTPQKTQTKDVRGRSDGGDKKGVQLVPEKEGKRPFSAPRPNKTAMLRAHNSREVVKNSGMKSRSPNAAKGKTTKNSFMNSATGADNACESPPSTRVWTPSAKRSGQSSPSNDNQETGETGVKAVETSNGSPVNGNSTQHAVDEIFESGPARVLPESLQMKRDDTVNKTFVLDEGKGDTSVSSLEEESMVAWVDTVSNSRNVTESKDNDDTSLPGPSPSRPQPPKLDLEATSSEGISLRSKLIPFAPFFKSQPYTPPLPDQPFEPPSDSPDDASGGARSSTVEGRPASPESVTSVPPALSPSPPSTPGAAVRSLFDVEGGAAGSQSRRQWGVTDKPVEDLMLSSIHAFSVELRLASESVLAKVKSLYEGSEELNGSSKSRTNSDNKQDSESAMPDWKSSHAEIAGIFRNLRKVELRLRTMEQALSIMCVAAKKEPSQTLTERKLSMVETSSSGSFQNWREFKIKARRNSWAVEHRNQFPVPPESEEDDVDTA